MPNYFQVKDAAPIVESLVKQLSAQTTITKVDTTNFVDAGKAVLAQGYENVMNALSQLVGRTITDVKTGADDDFALIDRSEDSFSDRIRKIYIYSKNPQASGMYNTDLATYGTNLGPGLTDTDGVGSQWEQAPYMPVERFFGPKEFTWQHEYTDYINQLNVAFTSEAELVDFLNGMRKALARDIKLQKTAKNRIAVLSRIAGNKLLVDKGSLGAECAVNLTKAFNDEYGTSYTTKELLTNHRIAFYKFFLAKFKIISKMMGYDSTMYHDPLTKTVDEVDYVVLSATPKDSQRFLYNEQLFTEVDFDLAEIFHPEKLAFPKDNAKGLMYWQDPKDPYKVDVTPALPEDAASSEVAIDIVLGLLFDSDALVSNNRYEGMLATPINARHGYRNEFYNFKYSIFSSYVDNSVLFYMSDNSTEYFEGDGATVAFELDGTATTIVSVTVNGVAKTSGTDFTFSSNTVTFTAAPADDAIIQIIYK